MTVPNRNLPKVPPFLEKKTSPPRRKKVDTRGMLSVATMLISMAALTVSMFGAIKLIFDIFDDGLANSMDGILVKGGVLGLAFLFGWSIGLVSIRAFVNLVYPFIIKVYAWACLAGVCALYIKVIQKLYMQQYDTLHFWAYLVMLLGGLIVLLFLHFLIEDHDLRPFSIPLMIVSVLHLFVIVYRYIFTTDADGQRVIGDFIVFLSMISISALMLMHIGLLSPVRDFITARFERNGNGHENGKQENGNGGK